MVQKPARMIILLCIAALLFPTVGGAQDANGVCRQPPNGAVAPSLPPTPRVVHRQTRTAPPVVRHERHSSLAVDTTAPADTIGYGDLGETGARSGEGYGSGAGRGLRGRGTAGPVIHTFDPLAWIRDTIHSHHEQMVDCYTRALDRNAGLTGHVTVRFTILSDGRVARGPTLSMDPDIDEPGFRACLVGAVERWTFTPPQSHGTTGVSYPYTFSQEETTVAPSPRRPGRT